MSEPYWTPLGGQPVDYEGAWSAGFQYAPGDVVTYQGITYLAVNPSLGVTPPSSTPTPLIPPGALVPYAGAAAPTGYLLCDGSAVSRTTYSDLFAAIGTAYGTGDGSTTFNLPDLRGRMAVGRGTHALVDNLGDSEGVALGNRSPSHAHIYTAPNSPILTVGGTAARNAVDSIASQWTTGNNGLQDTPAFLTVNYLIKT